MLPVEVTGWLRYIDRSLQNIYPYSQERKSVSWLLLTHYVKGFTALDYIMRKAHAVSTSTGSKILQGLADLQANKPIQYIVGEAHFLYNRLYVDQNVLIPRPETAEMVAHLLKQFTSSFTGKILDIGTGSGCIAVSIAKAFPHAKVIAVDISKKALGVAKRNAEQLKVAIHFQQLDILSEKVNGPFDCMVSNPPYIPVKEQENIHPRVKKYEPQEALFVSDKAPLCFYNRIIDLATTSLVYKGLLYLEVHENFAHQVSNLFSDRLFEEIFIHKDIRGKNRWITARKKAS